MDMGPREILILAAVVLVLFGSKQIPEVVKSLVDSIRHIRGAFKDEASPSVIKG